jgi:hypothetical protein
MSRAPKELGKILVAVALMFTAHSYVAGAAEEATGFAISAVPVQTPPKIDGTLDDPAWKNAAHVQLGWNFTFRQAAEETTDAYVLTDKQNLYVAFVAKQREAITATQHVNDQPLSSDDVVRVYLFPAGELSFEYMFVANPDGTRYETSSENTAFAPQWEAVARRTADGYIVTMRIPLNIMRGDGRKDWRIQFDRRIYSLSELLEWAHDPGQGSTDSSHYTGYLHGMTGASTASTRTKPRANVYALGELASSSIGGSTSRMGADIAIPITPTASFLGTFHPDYSNVELDQQTIAPTAFPRRYQEVRPFFTQGANFYNQMNCNDCTNYPWLYTPNIPTPRDGYAVEGVQGRYDFGAFDAIGDDRTDTAQAVQYATPNRSLYGLYQRMSTDYPGLHDVAQYGQLILGNAHNFNVYATEGQETGTLVSDPAEGVYREYGLNLFTPKEGIFAAYHQVGAQYGPPISFFQINDISGPGAYVYREFDNAPHSYVQNYVLSYDYQNYHNSLGELNDANRAAQLTVNTRNLFSLQLATGNAWVMFPGLPGGNNNQFGGSLSYNANGATPALYQYNIGRYAAGYLRASQRYVTLRVTPRGTITFEADDTNDTLDTGEKLVQWLERVSFAYQINRTSSLAIGVRRIIGTTPPFFTPVSELDTLYINASNISIAYYKRFPRGELYLAYGNPNSLATQPSAIAKYIFYVGAQKGT